MLHDLGMVDFTEPFSALLNQGMVGMNGSAMSKSRGNLVRLSDELAEHGVDAVRLTMVFAGPPEDDIDWADVSPSGSSKFLARAWRLSGDVTAPVGADSATGDVALRKVTHRAVDEAATAVESFRFNVAVARVMELVNATRKAIDSGRGGGRPRRARGGRGGRRHAVAVRAVHRRGDVGAARATSRRWPGPAGRASTRRCWSRRRSPASSRSRARCATASTWRRRSVRTSCASWRWPRTRCSRALDGRDIRTVIVRAPRLVNVVPA